jgi:hypothetical protein
MLALAMSVPWVYIICSVKHGVIKQIVNIFDDRAVAMHKLRRWKREYEKFARRVLKEVYCIIVRKADNLPIQVADHWE